MANDEALLHRCDPETLIGPLLNLYTRLAGSPDASLGALLQSRLIALARHPSVEIDLRLAAGAIAIELAGTGLSVQ